MQLSRRALLGLGVGSLGATRARAATDLSLPLLRDLKGDRLIERCGLTKHATLEVLGESPGGHPIELISVGCGPRSALVVAAPHPNEPIGCLTVSRMLRRLGGDPWHREASGYRWSFIPAIDPDGLALNQGWFRTPTPGSYCRDFFRPPFRRQPEYTFPLKVGKYEFAASTPENLAWQKALSATRPDLQCSLHGADSGGAFFICSDNRPALNRALAEIPARHGIALNAVGEPFSDMAPYQKGVMSFFDIPALLRQAQDEGAPPEQVWDAGDSSNGYAASHFRTFSMICEVPLWSDARSWNERASPYSTIDTLQAQIQVCHEDLRLLDNALGSLANAHATVEAEALSAALQAALEEAQRQPAALTRLMATADPAIKLSYADLVQYEPGTSAWRTPAMVARLARLLGRERIAAEANALLHRRVIAQRRAGRLTSVPLQASSSLQMTAIDAAASMLLADGSGSPHS